MSLGLLAVREAEELSEAIGQMKVRGVRRAPVVDDRGALVGILAVDDLLELVAEQLADLVKLISVGQTRERQRRG
jgi:Mg/Co/Ni transporter MgtE